MVGTHSAFKGHPTLIVQPLFFIFFISSFVAWWILPSQTPHPWSMYHLNSFCFLLFILFFHWFDFEYRSPFPQPTPGVSKYSLQKTFFLFHQLDHDSYINVLWAMPDFTLLSSISQFSDEIVKHAVSCKIDEFWSCCADL